MKNNLFKYATKELSQDAFLRWSINWINVEDENKNLKEYGKAMLDLLLGDNKLDEYYEVEVNEKQFQKQKERIDVLVLYKDKNNPQQQCVLIIEDKTDTFEHTNQIERYKDMIRGEYENPKINVAYVKTGIIYDVDYRIKDKAVVVGLEKILKVIEKYVNEEETEILLDYYNYILEKNKEREKIKDLINNGQYSEALEKDDGQYIFFNEIFENRTKETVIGNDSNNSPIYIDEIYAGTSYGDPWAQYCFWGKKYNEQIKNIDKTQYHYLFWRIDSNRKISLRHYDENARFEDEKVRTRKIEAYNKFRDKADDIVEHNDKILKKPRGNREKYESYKESELLAIPVKNISNMNFEDVKQLLLDITQSMKEVIK